MKQKKILVINRHAPYGSTRAREALDASLALGVFDQDVSLLFMDDGVFQLLDRQEPSGIQQKRLSANLQALPLYGIEKIYVHCESLEIRQITTNDLVQIQVQLLNSTQVGEMINGQDHILSF